MLLLRSVNVLLVMIPVRESFSNTNISLFYFGSPTDFEKQISLQILLLGNHGRSSYGAFSESITPSQVLHCVSFAAAVTNFKLNFKSTEDNDFQ